MFELPLRLAKGNVGIVSFALCLATTALGCGDFDLAFAKHRDGFENIGSRWSAVTLGNDLAQPLVDAFDLSAELGQLFVVLGD